MGILLFLNLPFGVLVGKVLRIKWEMLDLIRDFLPNTTHSHNQFIFRPSNARFIWFLSTVIFMSYLIYTFVRLRKMGDYEFASYGLILVCSYIFMFFLTDSPFIGSMHSTLFFIFCSLLFFGASLSG